jgi:hypothetical protein
MREDPTAYRCPVTDASSEAPRRAAWLLIAAAAAFAAAWFWFRPAMYLYSDEAGNLALAGVLARGTPFADVADRHLPETVPARDGHLASRYPPGMAGLLLPFTLVGLEWSFLLPLALHLAAFALLARLLTRRGLPPLWALLWLFYPTAALHSRMLMSNLPAAALLLCCYALLDGGGRWPALLAGLLAGAGPLLRPPLLPAAVVLGMCQIWHHRRALLAGCWRQRLLSPPALFALAALPGLIVALWYNRFVFGSVFDSGYRRVGDGSLFGAAALVSCLPAYLLILAAVYPLMVVSPLLCRAGRRAELVLVPAFYLLFYGSYGWFETGGSLTETVVRAPRFLLPAIPFLLLAYAGWLSPALRRLPGLESRLLAAAGAIGLAACVLLFGRHHEAQQRQEAVRDVLYAVTAENDLLICGVDCSELIQDGWGRRTVVDYAAMRDESALERIEAHLRRGGRVSLMVLDRPGAASFAGWGLKVRSSLESRWELHPPETRPLPGGGRLSVWSVGPDAR